ncbi:Pectate lyase superfamily protein [compost metagenome]
MIDVTSFRFRADPRGILDSAAIINAAIQYAKNNGWAGIFIPKGTYIMEESLKPADDIVIAGAGQNNTFLIAKVGADINGVEVIPQFHATTRMVLQDLCIDMNRANNTYGQNFGHGLNLAIALSTIKRVNFRNIAKAAIRVNFDDRLYANFDLTTPLNRIEENNIEDAGTYGLEIGYRCTDSWWSKNNIGSTIANVKLNGGVQRFMENHFDGTPDYNVWIPGGAQNLLFYGNIMENTNKNNVLISSPADWAMSRNISFVGNMITNASNAGDGVYDMLKFEGIASNISKGIMVTGNSFNDAGGNKPRYVVAVNDWDGVIVSGNSFTETHKEVEPIAFAAVTNGKVSGNTSDTIATKTTVDLNPVRD